MKEQIRITTARVSLAVDEDGRRTARLLAVSMGLLFTAILVLQAYTW